MQRLTARIQKTAHCTTIVPKEWGSSWRITVISALPDAELRQRIVRGVAWAREFTWARCLRQTVDVFRALTAH